MLPTWHRYCKEACCISLMVVLTWPHRNTLVCIYVFQRTTDSIHVLHIRWTTMYYFAIGCIGFSVYFHSLIVNADLLQNGRRQDITDSSACCELCHATQGCLSWMVNSSPGFGCSLFNTNADPSMLPPGLMNQVFLIDVGSSSQFLFDWTSGYSTGEFRCRWNSGPLRFANSRPVERLLQLLRCILAYNVWETSIVLLLKFGHHFHWSDMWSLTCWPVET